MLGVGQLFPHFALACVLDHALWSLGVKPLRGHRRVIAEERDRQRIARGRPDPPWERPKREERMDRVVHTGSDTEHEVFEMEELAQRTRPDEKAFIAAAERDPKMAVQMVSAFTRTSRVPRQ